MKWGRGLLFEEAPAPGGGGPALPPPPPSGDDGGGGGDEVDVVRLAQTVSEQNKTIERLAGVVRNIATPPPPAQPSSPTKPDGKALEEAFWKNPVGMTETITRQAVAEAMTQLNNAPNPSFSTLVAVARDQARNRDPKIFDLLRPEIEAKVASMPQQFHQSVEVWNNAFNMATGENMDRVIAERAKSAPLPPTPGNPGPGVPSPRPAPAPKEEKLTVEQEDFCRRFDLSPDEYRRGIQRLTAQGSGRADEPSSWDEVITFDSTKKRREERRKKEKASA